MNETAYRIAVKFCENIGGLLTREQIAEVVRRNENEQNTNICHSHDFCDANQAMIDAVGEEFYNSDPQNANINEAWDMAKSWGFQCPN